MTLKRLRAFTLIELLIVITIIGILAVALVPRIAGAPAKARDAARKADLQQIATGLEFYNDDHGNYPDTSACIDPSAASGVGYDLAAVMTTVPVDPSENSSTIVNSTTCSGQYYYLSIDSGSGYALFANLENDTAYGAGEKIYDSADVSGSLSSLTSIGDLDECSAAACSSEDAYYGIGG